jgi:hypothetical protein
MSCTSDALNSFGPAFCFFISTLLEQVAKFVHFIPQLFHFPHPHLITPLRPGWPFANFPEQSA